MTEQKYCMTCEFYPIYPDSACQHPDTPIEDHIHITTKACPLYIEHLPSDHPLAQSNTEKKNDSFAFKEIDLKDILSIQEKEHERRLLNALPPDHFISEYVSWMSSISDGYIDYQIVSALWLISALTKNRVVLRLKQEKVKTNLWIMAIGRSTTSRKSTIINKTRQTYELATDHVLPNEDYSIEGYLETLAQYPILNNVRDEAAGLMAKFHKKYNEGIFEMECAIYDCQNVKKTLSGGKSSSPKVYEIINPFVTKLYATTPDNFSRYMSIDDFTCGYGFRFLFASPNYKKGRMDLEEETNEDVEMWGRVLTRVKILGNFFNQLGGEVEFKINPEAKRYYNQVVKEMEMRAEGMNNEMYNSAIGRSQIHILKIAMLLELGKNEMGVEIKPDSMKVACDMVVNYFIPSMMDIIDRLQEDIKNNQIEKIISVIRRLGGVASHTKILHDAKLKSKDFNDCVSTMIQAKTIQGFRDKDTKAIFYRLLNTQNLQNLQNLQNHDISENIDNKEILESSNKLEKCIDNTNIRARITGESSSSFLRESEILEISGIRGILDKAVTELKKEYDSFNRPDSREDLERLVRNMESKLLVDFIELEESDIKRIVQDYIKARGWV